MRLKIHFSWVLLLAVFGIHFFAFFALFYVGLPFWITFLLLCFVIFDLCFCLRKYIFLKSTKSIVEIIYKNGVWFLVDKNHNVIKAEIKHQFVSSYLITLDFKVVGHLFGYLVVVSPRSVSNFRLLKVNLFYGR